jgi:hypothetical protein
VVQVTRMSIFLPRGSVSRAGFSVDAFDMQYSMRMFCPSMYPEYWAEAGGILDGKPSPPAAPPRRMAR